MLMSISMLCFSMLPLILSIYCLKFSLFILIEIPIISMSSMTMPMTMIMDWMSLLFLFTVLFISSMILMFSLDYIPYQQHKQFSLLLLMFILSMSLLILSNNIIFILLGWDGLGLSSFILVIYYQNFSSAASGSITIFSNRFGDIMIILSIGLLSMSSDWNFENNNSFPLFIMMLLMLASCSKSAQFPFSAWLPAAMAAPTPISALVHSSTLVTAGVFLLIRIMSSPHPFTMFSLMSIASATAIYASLSANWEMDMKKIIALSTLSQIAMMMFAIAIGAINLAFFHLIIHALFKSLMFLCAGIVIHSTSYQDMRKMGSFMNKSPLTMSILGLATSALMGIPFLSGFFSKDPIIESLISSKTLSFITILMIFSIGMTSMYSMRMIYFSMKFSMKSKPDINLTPMNMMEIPIMIMAPFSIFSGTMLYWILCPTQIIIIPFHMKIVIIFMLLSGIIMSMSISFLSNMYMKFGESALSLWFNHFILTLPTPFLSKKMNHMVKNDKYWQEYYGPLSSYNSLNSMSVFPDKMSLQMMFIIMIITILPIILLLLF